LVFYKRLPFIFLSIFLFILLFVLLGYQAGANPAYIYQQKMESIIIPDPDMFNKDPVMNLLGKSIDQIKQVLGETDEQGYSGWLGPSYNIYFRHKEGVVQSSETIENKIAVSIILGQGQEVLGARVGMLFSEIQDIFGAPDFGPELGMDNLYHMDYFFGEIINQTPEVFLSFSAYAVNSPTHQAFVKWEGFEYGQIKILQAQR
jgi:hypothetical protein